MPDLVFFYSSNDPTVAGEALRLGYFLVEKKHYNLDEELILLSATSNGDPHLFCHFYVLPEARFISEISMGSATEVRSGKDFRYIKDRNGAAAILLSLNTRPSEGEVSVGSLEFSVRTYPSDSEPLEPRPPIFSSVFRNLRSFVKRSAQPVSNKLFPKTVYVFPQAMSLLRQDFSRSPWSSLEIKE